MPKSEGINTEQSQDNGKIYPWMLEADFSYYKAMEQYVNFMNGPSYIVGKNKEVSDKQEDLDEIAEGNLLSKEDVEGVPGMDFSKGRPVVQASANGQGTGDFFTSEQKPDGQKIYEDIKEVADEATVKLRSDYTNGTDAGTRRLHDRSVKYADFIDLGSEALNPDAGNMIKAEFDNPALGRLANSWADAPRFEEKGFEVVTDIMDQAHDPNGVSIFDDYMTVSSASLRGYKVEFHRQQMEKDGWDGEKERTYLGELRLENQKTVEAYDNLWAVHDTGQYDNALGNPLDAMIGKNPIHHRTLNEGVGYMRGQVQAIDMGYDSRHLHILGQLGIQDQMLKKCQAEIDFETEQNKGVLTPELKERQQHLNEYNADFQRFREGIWNKKVNGKEEMEAAGKQVDDFFTAHNTKFADLQKGALNEFAAPIEYNKEMASRSPEIPRPSQRLKTSDVQGLQMVIATQMLLGGEEIVPNGIAKMADLMERSSKGKNQVEGQRGELRADLVESFDKECKDLAKEFSVGLDRCRESHKDTQHPRTQTLREGILDYAGIQADALRDGRHLNDQESPDSTFAHNRVTTLFPQLDTSLFDPGKIDKTEAALKDYPIDKYVKQGLEIHRMETEYKDKKASMTEKERDAFQERIRDKKEDFLDTAKDLHKKSLNPTPETLSLFGSEILLTSKDNGFVSGRGLEGLIRGYEKEFAGTDIPDSQMDRLSSALGKISAKRAGLFDSEGDERRLMREQAEKIQGNLKTLKSGMIDTPTGPRVMTQEEKSNLLADTIDGLNDLSAKTDKYTDHATKGGTKTPSGAGKTRLDGARELKDLTNDLQDTLMKEQQAQMRRENRRAQKQMQKEKEQNGPGLKSDERSANKEDRHRSISLKEMMEKDKKEAPQRKRSQSVREPSKRTALENRQPQSPVKTAPKGPGKR